MTKKGKNLYEDMVEAPKDETAEEHNGDGHAQEQEEADEGIEYPSHEEVESELLKVEQERDQLKNKVLELHAELENVRKRADKEVERARKYSNAKVIEALLGSIDSLESGLKIEINDNELASKLHEGMEMTLDMLLKALEKFGLKQLNPVGETFNPDYHEAMQMLETKDHDPNTVTQVLQTGYVLHDRLVRPALVVVAKG